MSSKNQMCFVEKSDFEKINEVISSLKKLCNNLQEEVNHLMKDTHIYETTEVTIKNQPIIEEPESTQ